MADDNRDDDFISQLPKDDSYYECKLFIVNGILKIGLLDPQGNVIAEQPFWNHMVDQASPLLVGKLAPHINQMAITATTAAITAANIPTVSAASAPTSSASPQPFKTLKRSSPLGNLKSPPVVIDTTSGSNSGNTSISSDDGHIDIVFKNRYYKKWQTHRAQREAIYGKYVKTDSLVGEFRCWFESTCSVARFGDDAVRKATLYALCETFIQDNNLSENDASQFRSTLRERIDSTIGATQYAKRKHQP